MQYVSAALPLNETIANSCITLQNTPPFPTAQRETLIQQLARMENLKLTRFIWDIILKALKVIPNWTSYMICDFKLKT